MSIPPLNPSPCPHCAQPVAPSSPAAPFCCRGCEAAHRFLHDAGLARFYDLRRGPGVPVGEGDERGPRPWLAGLVEAARAASGGGSAPLTLELDLQGIHCAACVWLIDTLFRREPGAVHAAIDPGLGRLRLTFRPDAFPLRGFLDEIERFGYRVGPARKEAGRAADDLLVRVGVTAAVAMNSMMLSIAGYLGLGPDTDAALFRVFSWANLGLSVIALLVGGPVFFRAAWQGLKRGILHLDVPIALGLLLAFGGSVWLFATGHAEAAYFDTLNVFVALMLLGRWLQRRVVERNRRMLLADPGVDGLQVRALRRDGAVEMVPVASVRPGATLLVAPGELVPVDASLLDHDAAFSLAWINGEPEPAPFAPGQAIPAGAHHAGREAVRVEALGDFDGSGLRRLLTPTAREELDGASAGFWHRLSTAWVVAVLTFAALGAVLWASQGLEAALGVTVAVLVITCPCAIGLATPLAYELAQTALRRRGLFVRRDDTVDRLAAVRHVLFDKTGTLTLGRLELATPGALDALDAPARDALFQMAARSNHPKSRALFAALQARPGRAPALRAEVRVVERPGLGLDLADGDATWTLRAAARAGDDDDEAPAGAVVLARGGRPVARLGFVEAMRHDAAAQVAELTARGLTVHLLSGDAPHRAASAARALGIDPARALGGLSPDDKAARVRALDARDTLFIGDGINDGPALDAAFCAGTPAVDSPSLPERADFYLLTSGVGPLAAALDLAARVRRTVRRNLAFAVAYNAAGVALALAGVLSPLACAVAMPLSSLTVVTMTVAALRGPGAAAPAPAAACPVVVAPLAEASR